MERPGGVAWGRHVSAARAIRIGAWVRRAGAQLNGPRARAAPRLDGVRGGRIAMGRLRGRSGSRPQIRQRDGDTREFVRTGGTKYEGTLQFRYARAQRHGTRRNRLDAKQASGTGATHGAEDYRLRGGACGLFSIGACRNLPTGDPPLPPLGLYSSSDGDIAAEAPLCPGETVEKIVLSYPSTSSVAWFGEPKDTRQGVISLASDVAADERPPVRRRVVSSRSRLVERSTFHNGSHLCSHWDRHVSYHGDVVDRGSIQPACG